MRKTLTAMAATLMIIAASAPVHAGYGEASTNLRKASENSAWAWYNAMYHTHWAQAYNYVDWGLIYSAIQHGEAARDQAYYAWWNAPSGSYAEYYAGGAYWNSASAVDNLWNVYVSGGNPTYTTRAIDAATSAQLYMAYAAEAAAWRF